MARFKYILFAVSIAFSCFAQTYPDYRVNYLLSEGVQNLVDQNFEKASNYFSTLNRDYPQLPIGLVSMTTLELYKFQDNFKQDAVPEIYSLLDSSISKSEQNLNELPSDLWIKYFLGLAHSNYAIFESELGNIYSAYQHSSTAAGLMSEVIEKDSLFYDAYGILGSYMYWKSAKTEFINWLPFIADEKEEGIKLLETAVTYGNYNSFFSANSLVWIYSDFGQIADAKAKIDSLLIKFPKNRALLFTAASVYSKLDIEKSNVFLMKLDDLYITDLSKYIEPQIVVNHKIAMNYVKLNKFALALEKCNYILSFSNLENIESDKILMRLERVEKLKNQLIEQIQN